MSPEEQRRRRAVQGLARVWPNGWTKHRADAYHDAVCDHHPDDVEAACAELCRTWTHLVIPPPAEIIGHATRSAADRLHAQQERTAAAMQARGEDRDRTTGRLHVHGRTCHTCDGDLTYLQAERILWCDDCRSAQVIEEVGGKTRVRLTHPEWQELTLEPERLTPRPHRADMPEAA